MMRVRTATMRVPMDYFSEKEWSKVEGYVSYLVHHLGLIHVETDYDTLKQQYNLIFRRRGVS